MRLANGYQISQAIHAAAALKLSDFVGDSPTSANDVAAAAGAHPGSVYRLLRALSTLGIFHETDDRLFEHTPVSELLRSDRPGSLLGWPAFIGRDYHWQSWGDLVNCIRTGEDATRHLYGVDIWQYRAGKPEETAIFNRAMAAISGSVAPSIIAACDFGRFDRIMDIGGADGSLMVAILRANPHPRGVVFDLPHVVEAATTVIKGAELGERCEIIGGSYYDSIPAGADACILKSTLMDLTDDEAVEVLGRVRKALNRGGSVLVLEGLIGAPNTGQRDAFSDLNMLVATGGRDRRRDEWEALFSAAGLTLESVTPTASRFHILEARPTR